MGMHEASEGSSVTSIVQVWRQRMIIRHEDRREEHAHRRAAASATKTDGGNTRITVTLLRPPLPLVCVSIAMERERQQNDGLVNGYRPA